MATKAAKKAARKPAKKGRKRALKPSLEPTPLDKVRLPPGLSREAKQEFERIRAALEEVGYTEIDQPALVAYLTHWGVFVKARSALARDGLTITTSRGSVQINPMHAILRQSSELLKKWVQELGFSPGARRRLKIQFGEAAVDDEEELFGL